MKRLRNLVGEGSSLMSSETMAFGNRQLIVACPSNVAHSLENYYTQSIHEDAKESNNKRDRENRISRGRTLAKPGGVDRSRSYAIPSQWDAADEAPLHTVWCALPEAARVTKHGRC